MFDMYFSKFSYKLVYLRLNFTKQKYDNNWWEKKNLLIINNHILIVFTFLGVMFVNI